MGYTGAGRLAEARHVSAFRHQQTAATAAPVRVTPREKRRFLARRAKETEQRRALFNSETDAEET